MSNGILLSIIIPIYNKADYLTKCLCSLKRQKFDDDVEVLLVDDGSTDESLFICREFAGSDSHYRIIHQDNQGVSGARNTGLANARGKYLAWIDPDDYITDDWYRTVSDALASCPNMLYFDMYSLGRGKLREVVFDTHSRILSKQELCEELAIGYRMKSHLCSKIFLRTIFDQYFSSAYSYCEDYAVMHKVCMNVDSCLYLHKTLYVYRQVSESITHDKDKILENCLLGIKLNKNRYRFYKKNKIKVSELGIYFAMLDYCVKYSMLGDISNNRYEKLYKKYMIRLKNSLPELLKYEYMSLWQKVKVCMFILGGEISKSLYSKVIKRYL